MKRLAFIFLITLFIGCKTNEPVIQIPVKTVERKVTTYVPIPVPGDSALLRAVFECDSLSRVLLKDLEEIKGGKVGSAFGFKNGVLDYRADFKPDTAYMPSDTVYTEKEVPVPVEVEKVEYRQTAFQNFLSWTGGIALALIALWGGWILLKRKFKIF